MPKPRFSWGRYPRSLVADPIEEVGDHDRPTVRGECRHGIRPCPFVGCRHHLYLNPEVYGKYRTYKILCNFPDWGPLDLPETCALDVAERGGIDIVEIGVLLNLSKSGVEKILKRALARVNRRLNDY